MVEANTSDQNPEQQTPDTEKEAPAKPPAPNRRKRRWLLKAFLVLLILVGVLVGLAPTIASSGAATDYIVSTANKTLAGKLELGGLSLSWTGPTTIEGIKLFDPDDREVLNVAKITYEGGLWRIITSGTDFGEVTIDTPKVLLHMDEYDDLTLLRAVSTREPMPVSEDESAGGTTIEPRGRLIVSNGEITISREGVPSYDISAVNLDVGVDTLAKLESKIAATFADGRTLTTEADIQNLFTNGEIDINAAKGSIDMHTDGDVAIGPLANILMPDQGLSGATNIKLNATFADGAVNGTFETNLVDLQTADRAASNAAPVDLKLTANVDANAERIDAKTDLSGSAGGAHAELAYTFSDQPLNLTADHILAAILEGKSVELPDFNVKAEAHIDLATLDGVLPGLLPLREGQDLTAGRLDISNLTAAGGTQPAAGGSIALKDVAATGANGAVRLQPITIDFDTRLVDGKGLELKQMNLASSFATLRATGNASSIQADFESHLANLQREIGTIIDLGGHDFAGDMRGKLTLARTGDEQFNITTQINANGLRYVAGDKPFEVSAARINHAGQLKLLGGQLERYTATSFDADLDGEVKAVATGWYDLQGAGFHADIDLQRADLGFIAKRAPALGMDELARYGGVVSFKGQADAGASTEPIRMAGDLLARNLSADGKPITQGDAKIALQNILMAADASDIRVERASLTSTPATLTAKDIQWKAGDELVMRGNVNGTADVARCMQAVALITKMDEPPALAGQLQLDARCETGGGKVKITTSGNVAQLAFGTGDQAVREQNLRFESAALINQSAERITIDYTRLTSTPLSAEITGRIDRYGKDAELDLRGRYDASWKELTTLLHELAPATAQTIIVTGKSASKFSVTGPATKPEVTPSFRGLSTGADVGWASARMYGVDLGGVSLSPRLDDGQLVLPTTSIPAAQGRVNLGGAIDMRSAETTLRMPGQTRVLDGITITPELSSSLLSRINPIFMHLTRVEGQINLLVQDLVFPLGDTMTTASGGRGHLDLIEMRVQPAGFLSELLALGGIKKEMQAVSVSGLDFLVRDGRISYKDFTLTFANGYDLKFYGSVGLDETLDLSVSLPVRKELLERLGVKGPVAEYARVLTKSRLDIPLVGTRQKPKLDFSRVDVKKLIEHAVKETAGKKAQGLLQGLLQGAQKKDDKKK